MNIHHAVKVTVMILIALHSALLVTMERNIRVPLPRRAPQALEYTKHTTIQVPVQHLLVPKVTLDQLYKIICPMLVVAGCAAMVHSASAVHHKVNEYNNNHGHNHNDLNLLQKMHAADCAKPIAVGSIGLCSSCVGAYGAYTYNVFPACEYENIRALIPLMIIIGSGFYGGYCSYTYNPFTRIIGWLPDRFKNKVEDNNWYKKGRAITAIASGMGASLATHTLFSAVSSAIISVLKAVDIQGENGIRNCIIATMIGGCGCCACCFGFYKLYNYFMDDGLSEKIDQVQKNVTEVKETVEQIDKNVHSLQEGMNKVQGGIDDVQKEQKKLEITINNNHRDTTSNLDTLKNKVEIVASAVTNVTDAAKANYRSTINKLDQMDDNLAEIESTMQKHQQESLKKIGAITALITNTKNDLGEKIESINTNVEDYFKNCSTRLDRLHGLYTHFDEKINDLDAHVGMTKAEINQQASHHYLESKKQFEDLSKQYDQLHKQLKQQHDNDQTKQQAITDQLNSFADQLTCIENKINACENAVKNNMQQHIDDLKNQLTTEMQVQRERLEKIERRQQSDSENISDMQRQVYHNGQMLTFICNVLFSIGLLKDQQLQQNAISSNLIEEESASAESSSDTASSTQSEESGHVKSNKRKHRRPRKKNLMSREEREKLNIVLAENFSNQIAGSLTLAYKDTNIVS